MRASEPRMMRRIVHQGRRREDWVEAEVDEVAETVTREERQTPNSATTVQSAATQVPCLSVVVELQLVQAPSPPLEHVAHSLEHATHDPFDVSKYSFLEHVWRHVPEELRTGREEGQVRQVSKVVPQVAQSGWQDRQVALLGGEKKEGGQEGPAMQLPSRESWVESEHEVQ